MRAVILAAGVGQRLGPRHNAQPKVLLRFGGETLLSRHLHILGQFGVETVDICVGYRADDIKQEITRLGAPVAVYYNPDFERGSIVSLVCTRAAFAAGDDVLFIVAAPPWSRHTRPVGVAMASNSIRIIAM